eukprot:CAMPEP_0179291472 /NCGR_PEP_ID=MMETSP0797-20121207/42355_1 /TAXON_ID=47934 /ORGANISM="Dinophysis acuminata, Strain DAEP01" /LENGTH=132 /DNA_ID=CAMNT_0021000549 /DNA_START=86 /DNA_END=484 /DNA_ORIENTATION=+
MKAQLGWATWTLTLLELGARSSACWDYHKHDSILCADACLEDWLNFCPWFILVSGGGLRAGTCGDVGFPALHGNMTVIAGPCGRLTFTTYVLPPANTTDTSSTTTSTATTAEVNRPGSDDVRRPPAAVLVSV